MHRILIIDSIRFIAALAVVFHHVQPPGLIGVGAELYRDAFFGPAAVLIFFVVSGFCIHLPYADATSVDWRKYFIRRYVRISIPVLTAAGLGALFGVSYHPYGGWVTWSIIAEMVYYTAYPALRGLADRIGWIRLALLSFVPGYVSVAIWSQSPDTVWLRAIADNVSNLPAWILGCGVAATPTRSQRPLMVVIMRMAVFTTFFGIGYVHYNHGIRFNWTLPAASLVVALWIWMEVWRDTQERFLSKMGEWSYSLYLFHPLAAFGLAPLIFDITSPAKWAIAILLCLAGSYAFFKVVEKPSHVLAKRLSQGSSQKSTSAIRMPTDPEKTSLAR